MATLAAGNPVTPFAADQSFFVKLAWVLAIFIVAAFAQNAALGRVDIPRVPVWVHLHGLAMIGWLAVFVTQNRLAAAGQFAQHRRLGRAAAVLVAVIVGLTVFASVKSIELGRFPPFFTPAYFLLLSPLGGVAFGGLVAAGVVNRRDTEMHRRLMTGATIVLLDPALGRVVPMPLLGGERAEWLVAALLLAVVAVIARHDRQTLGRVHPGTIAVAVTIVLVHAVVSLGSRSEAVIGLAARIAGTA